MNELEKIPSISELKSQGNSVPSIEQLHEKVSPQKSSEETAQDSIVQTSFVPEAKEYKDSNYQDERKDYNFDPLSPKDPMRPVSKKMPQRDPNVDLKYYKGKLQELEARKKEIQIAIDAGAGQGVADVRRSTDDEINLVKQHIENKSNPKWRITTNDDANIIDKDIIEPIVKKGEDKRLLVEKLLFDNDAIEKTHNHLRSKGLNEVRVDEAWGLYRQNKVDSTLASIQKDVYKQKYGQQADHMIQSSSNEKLWEMFFGKDSPEFKIATIQKQIDHLELQPGNEKTKFNSITKLREQIADLGGKSYFDNKGRKVNQDPNQKPEEAQYDQEVNAEMDRIEETPNYRNNLQSLKTLRFLAFERIKELRDQYNMNENNSFNGKPAKPLLNKYMDVSDPKYFQALEIEYYNKKKELEAATRLADLNQDPDSLKGNKTDQFLAKAVIEEFVPSYTTSIDLKIPFQTILNEAQVPEKLYNKENLIPTWGEEMSGMAGGVVNVGVKFAAMSTAMGEFGAMKFIQDLKMASQIGTGMKAWSSMAMKRTAGTLLDLAYQEGTFQAIGGAPGEGAVFGIVMGGQARLGAKIAKSLNKSAEGMEVSKILGKFRKAKNPATLTELTKGVAELEQVAEGSYGAMREFGRNVKAFAPMFAAETVKGSVGLTIANNSIAIAKGLAHAMNTDENFQYQMDKIYGVDEDGSNKWGRYILNEVIANLAFGPINFPEKLVGLNHQYKAIAEKQIDYLEQLKFNAEYAGPKLKFAAELLDNFIQTKNHNLDKLREKKQYLKDYNEVMGSYQKNIAKMSQEELRVMNYHKVLRDEAIQAKRKAMVPMGENQIEKEIIEIIRPDIDNFIERKKGVDHQTILSILKDNIQEVSLKFQNAVEQAKKNIKALEGERDQILQTNPGRELRLEQIQEKINENDKIAVQYQQYADYLKENETNPDAKPFLRNYVEQYAETKNPKITAEELKYSIERRNEIAEKAGKYELGDEVFQFGQDGKIYSYESGEPIRYKIIKDDGASLVVSTINPETGELSPIKMRVAREDISRTEKTEMKRNPILAEHKALLEEKLLDENLPEGERNILNAQLSTIDTDPVGYVDRIGLNIKEQIEKIKADPTLSTAEKTEAIEAQQRQLSIVGDEKPIEEKIEEKVKQSFTVQEQAAAFPSLKDITDLKSGKRKKSDILTDLAERTKKFIKDTTDRIAKLSLDGEQDKDMEKSLKDAEKNLEKLVGKPKKEGEAHEWKDMGFIDRAKQNEQRTQDKKIEKEREVAEKKRKKLEEYQANTSWRKGGEDEQIQNHFNKGLFFIKSQSPDGKFHLIVEDSKKSLKESRTKHEFDTEKELMDFAEQLAIATPEITEKQKIIEKKAKTITEADQAVADALGLTIGELGKEDLTLDDVDTPDVNKQKGQTVFRNDDETIAALDDWSKFVPLMIKKAFQKLYVQVKNNPSLLEGMTDVGAIIKRKFDDLEGMVNPLIVKSERRKVFGNIPKASIGWSIMELPERERKLWLEHYQRYIEELGPYQQLSKAMQTAFDLLKKSEAKSISEYLKTATEQEKEIMVDAINMDTAIKGIDDSARQQEVFDKAYNRVYKAIQRVGGFNDPKKAIYDWFKNDPLFESKLKQGPEVVYEYLNEHKGIISKILRNQDIMGYKGLVSFYNYINSLVPVEYISYKVSDDGQSISAQNANQNTARIYEFEKTLRSHLMNLLKFNQEAQIVPNYTYSIADTKEGLMEEVNILLSRPEFKRKLTDLIENAQRTGNLEMSKMYYAEYLHILTGIETNLWKDYFHRNTERDFLRNHRRNVPSIIKALEKDWNNEAKMSGDRVSGIYKFFTNVDISADGNKRLPDGNLVKLMNVLTDKDSKDWQITDSKTKKTIPALEQQSFFSQTLASISTSPRLQSELFKNNAFVTMWRERNDNPHMVKIAKIFSSGNDKKRGSEKSYKDISRNDLTRIFLYNFLESKTKGSYLGKYKQFANKDQHYLIEVPKIRDAKKYYEVFRETLDKELLEAGYYPKMEDLEHEVDKLYAFLHSPENKGKFQDIIQLLKGIDPKYNPDKDAEGPQWTKAGQENLTEEEANFKNTTLRHKLRNQTLNEIKANIDSFKKRAGVEEIYIMNPEEVAGDVNSGKQVIIYIVNPKQLSEIDKNTDPFQKHLSTTKYKESVDFYANELFNGKVKVVEYTGEGKPKDAIEFEKIDSFVKNKEQIQEIAEKQKNASPIEVSDLLGKPSKEFVPGQKGPERDIVLENASREEELIKEGLREFVYNEAINEINLDQVVVGDAKGWLPQGMSMKEYILNNDGKHGINKFRDEIVKRLGSFNSTGMRLLQGMKDGIGYHENHLVLKDLPFSLIKGGAEWKTKKYTDGAEFYFAEHGRRMLNSAGEVIGKNEEFTTLESVKPIYVDIDMNNNASLMKGNAFDIESLAKYATEGSVARQIIDFVRKYNEGKAYEDQIHSLSFSPSTTKLTSKKPLDLFSAEADGSYKIKAVSESMLNDAIDKRSTDNWLWQQDLRNSIVPEEAVTPSQEKGNLSHQRNNDYILKIQNKIGQRVFEQAVGRWHGLDKNDRREFVRELMKDMDILNVKEVLELGGNIDNPFFKKLVYSFIASRISNEGVREKGNRVTYQEIPNIFGISHESFRNTSDHLLSDWKLVAASYDPRKDSKKDKDAWIAKRIEWNEQNLIAEGKHRQLLPQVSMNVPGARYGAYYKYYTESEINRIRLENGFVDKPAEFEVYRKRNKIRTREEVYASSLKFMGMYNDFHVFDKEKERITRDVKYWELEETTKNEKGEAGNYFYIPGDIVKVTRVPGHGPVSHTMARLHTKLETASSTNFIITPFEIQISAGSDFDGDKRFIEVLAKGKFAKLDPETGKQVRIEAKDPNGKVISSKQVLMNINDENLDIAVNSGRNAKLMLLADDFGMRGNKENLEHELDLTKLDQIVNDYSKQDLANYTMSAYFDSFERNRLVFKTVSQIAAIQNVYDAFKKLSTTLKKGSNGQGISVSIDKGIFSILNNQWLSDKDGKNKVLTINGFSKDEYHQVKDYLGLVLNLALDNPKDPKVDRLGITEHTANMFAYLLMGDTGIDGLGKEEQAKELYSRIETISAYLNSPIVRTYIDRIRNMSDVNDYQNAYELFWPEIRNKKNENYLGNDPRLQEIYGAELPAHIKQLEKLYTISEESGSIYQFLKLPKDMPNNPAKYIASIMQYGRILMNDFEYIDTSSFFEMKAGESHIKPKDFFNASGEGMSYLLNPMKDLSFDKLHPYLKPIGNALGMAAELFGGSIDLSKQGRKVYGEFISSFYNEKSKDIRTLSSPGRKYLREKAFEEISSMLNDFSLKMTVYGNGESNNLSVLTDDIQSVLHHYSNFGTQRNRFLDMIKYYSSGRDGYEYQDRTIALDQTHQRKKIPDSIIEEAKEDFEMLKTPLKMAMIRYLVTKYGSVSSNWGGSYIQLIPAKYIKMIGDAHEKTMEAFNQDKLSPEQEAKLVTYFFNARRDATADVKPWANIRRGIEEFDPIKDLRVASSFDYNADKNFINSVIFRTVKQTLESNGMSENYYAGGIPMIHDLIRNGVELRGKTREDLDYELGYRMLNIVESESKDTLQPDFRKRNLVQGFKVLKVQWLLDNARRVEDGKSKQNFFQFISGQVLAGNEKGEPLMDNGKYVFKENPEIKTGTESALDELIRIDSEKQKGKNNKFRIARLQDGTMVEYSDRFGNKKQAKVIARRFSKKFNIPVEFSDLGANAGSFYDKANKRVVLNLRDMDSDLSIHEFLHPFYNAIVEKYPTLKSKWTNEIIALAKETPKFTQAVSEILNTYKKSELASELFTYYMSAMAGHNFRNRTIAQRVRDRLMDVIQTFADTFGIKWGSESIEKYKDASIDEILSMLESRKKVVFEKMEASQYFNSNIDKQEGISVSGLFGKSKYKEWKQKIQDKKNAEYDFSKDEIFERAINDPNNPLQPIDPTRGGNNLYNPDTGRIYNKKTKRENETLTGNWKQGANPDIKPRFTEKKVDTKAKLKSLTEGYPAGFTAKRAIEAWVDNATASVENGAYLLRKFRLKYGKMDDAAFSEFFTQFEKTKTHINRVARRFVNTIKYASKNPEVRSIDDLKKSLMDESIQRIFQPKVYADLINSLADYITKNIVTGFRNDGTMNPLSDIVNSQPVFYRNSGLYDVPVWIKEEADGTRTLYKFHYVNGKYFENDGSVSGRTLQPDGTFKVEKNNQFDKQYRGNSLFQNIDLAATKKNELMVEAHTLALMYEETAQLKVGKVVIVPIQVQMDVEKVDKTMQETSHRNLDIDMLGVNDMSEVIRDARVIDAPETNFTITAEGRMYAQENLAANERYRTREDYKKAIESIDSPEFNKTHKYSGPKSKWMLKQARRNLVEMIKKPIGTWTMDDFNGLIPYAAEHLIQKFVNDYKFTVEEVNNMSLNDIVAVEFSRVAMQGKGILRDRTNNSWMLQFDKNTYEDTKKKIDNGKYNYQSYLESKKIIDNAWSIIDRKYRKGDMNNMDVLNELAKDQDMLVYLQHLIMDLNPAAVGHLNDFISNQMTTNDMFREVLKENTPGYEGTRIMTLFADRLFRGDNKLWQDTRHNSLLLYILPKSKLGSNVLPASFLLNKISIVESKRFAEIIEKKDLLKKIRPDRFDRIIEEVKNISETSTEEEIEFAKETHKWIPTEKAFILYQNGEISKKEFDFVKTANEILNEYAHTNPYDLESKMQHDVTWTQMKTGSMVLQYSHFWNNPIDAKRINRALRQSELDNVLIKGYYRNENDPYAERIEFEGTFGDYKYLYGPNWNTDMLSDSHYKQNGYYLDLMHNYNAAKKASKEMVRNEVNKEMQTQIGVPLRGKTENVIIRAPEDMVTDPNIFKRKVLAGIYNKMIFDSLIERIDELMVRERFAKVLPYADVISHGYELGHGLESNPNKIKGYLDKIIRNEIYKQDVDYMLSNLPFLRNTISNLIRVAAGLGISWKVSTQIMNVLQGYSQNVINNSGMLTRSLLSAMWSIPSIAINPIRGRNSFAGANVIKLWNVMEKMHVGVVRDVMGGDMFGSISQSYDKYAFGALTLAERINQAPLVYGFMKSMRPEYRNEYGEIVKRNIFDAYNNKGEVKKGMEDLALKDFELQMLRNFVENVHGHYGKSRAIYSYYALGRLAGMFKVPWMAAQAINIWKKYSIDANEVETVGFINGTLQSMGAIIKYALKGNDEKWVNEVFQKTNLNHMDEASLTEWYIANSENTANPLLRDRLRFAMEQLPDAHKMAFKKLVMFATINTVMLALARGAQSMYQTALYEDRDDLGNPIEVENNPGNIEKLTAWLKGRDANLKYRKTGRSLKGKGKNLLTEDDYRHAVYGTTAAKMLTNVLTSTAFLDIQSGASMPGVVIPLRKAIDILTHGVEAIQAMTSNNLTEIQIKKKLEITASGGAKNHQVLGRYKLWDAILNAVPVANLVTQREWVQRTLDPSIGYQERVDEIQEMSTLKAEETNENSSSQSVPSYGAGRR